MSPNSSPDDTTAVRRGGRPSRRTEIVVAAMEAFASTGYHNTSLNDIADQLDMTAAGILHHFKTKENLLVEVLDQRDDSSPSPVDSSGRAMFQSLIEVTERNERSPGLTQLYAVLSAESLTHDHPAQDWFRDRYDRVRTSVRAALVDILGPDAEKIPDRVDEGTRTIIAAMDGLQIQFLLEPECQPMVGSMRLVMEAVIHELQRAIAEA
ncbi:TetR/AcrR family transcriptional regulator [Aestuariimicrobium soli]|uniref:TetR/AcrR family transcriptional regulator n=1 Tax=Aestuariimicrobium soli TaxID=2035834 RepID=UPI003EBDF68A